MNIINSQYNYLYSVYIKTHIEDSNNLMKVSYYGLFVQLWA